MEGVAEAKIALLASQAKGAEAGVSQDNAQVYCMWAVEDLQAGMFQGVKVRLPTQCPSSQLSPFPEIITASPQGPEPA